MATNEMFRRIRVPRLDTYCSGRAAQAVLQFESFPARIGAVALTRDEWRALQRLYGFVDDPSRWQRLGADRNMIRHAETDGIRLLARLAKYCAPGQDPIEILAELFAAAGYDEPDESGEDDDEQP